MQREYCLCGWIHVCLHPCPYPFRRFYSPSFWPHFPNFSWEFHVILGDFETKLTLLLLLLLLSRFSRVRLCDPIDGSPPGSPVPGILRERTLEWVAISFSTVKSESEVVQSCPTPSDPMDCSLPGSSAHGIFQARVLEWVAIAYLHMVNWQN